MTKNMKKLYSAALAMLVTLLLPVVVLAAGKEIIILHTNDIHCGITDNLGIDKVSQYKKDLKKQGYPVALVDAGDAIQGAPIGKLSTGESIVKIMNAVGYDFVIPGNQKYKPACYTVEGDWSSAAFFAVLGALRGKVTCLGLNNGSLQADRKGIRKLHDIRA